MLKQRILTALILIPLVLFTILWLDYLWFSSFFALIIVLGAWEWAGLCGSNKTFSIFYSLLTALIIATLYLLNDQEINNSIIIISIFYWIFAATVIVAYQFRKNLLPASRIIKLVIGLLILVSTWLALTYIKLIPEIGSYLVIYLLFLIWAADSGAYFIGRKWGKKRLASLVSPGKTWEGAIGGIIFGLFVTMTYVFVINSQLNNVMVFIGISIITILASVIGDLMESMMKRIANIKDSGNILPGHGGVMDRIDSLTAAAPVFAFGLIFMSAV